MTAMTPTEIVERVKRTFGDESGVQITNDDILRWINDAQREAAMQTDGLLRATTYIEAEPGVGVYGLPSNCITLQGVAYTPTADPSSSYYQLRYLSNQELDEFISGWDGSDFDTADPIVFTRGDNGRQFHVFPRPPASNEFGFKLSYVRYPAAVATLNGTIDLPEYLHLYVLEYCLMKAYEVDEDWEAADKKASYIQSSLDFNNQRDAWFGQQAYPVVGTTAEDYY